MVIKLHEVWYPYCEIDAATVQRLLTAESAALFTMKKFVAAEMAPTVRSTAAIIRCRNTPDGNEKSHTDCRGFIRAVVRGAVATHYRQ
jgi:hypothetical protein